jgi:hypothetical protein
MGMVYFVRCQNEDGYIKIGFTAGKVEARLYSMQADNPYPLELLGTMVASDTELEREVQANFAHLCVRGEWHKPTPELLEFAEGGHEGFVSFWETIRQEELANRTYEQAELLEKTRLGHLSPLRAWPNKHWHQVRKTRYIYQKK